MPANNNTNQAMGETPFKPEYDEFIKEYPGRGSLKVQINIADEAFPVSGVNVDVAMIYKGKRYSIYKDVTDSSGIVNKIVLPSRPREDSLTPESAEKGDVEYLISAYRPGFEEVIDSPVFIHDRVETILPIELSPNGLGTED